MSFSHVVVSIGLDQPAYAAPEDSGPIPVCVSVLSGELQRNINVTIQFLPATGLTEDIAETVIEPLVFSELVTRICREVVLVEDEMFEEAETYFIELVTEEESSVVSLDSGIRAASITILNDDGMCA